MSKAVNVSESHIGDTLGCGQVVPDNPHKLRLYEYHLADHKKPFPAVPYLITCVNQVVHYVPTSYQLYQDLHHNDGNDNE